MVVARCRPTGDSPRWSCPLISPPPNDEHDNTDNIDDVDDAKENDKKTRILEVVWP